MKFEEGKTYRCVASESSGYKLGRTYTVYKNEKNVLCLRGSDGFEDPCSKLVSRFKEATLTEVKT